MESKKITAISRIAIVSAVFLMLSLCIVPASAATFSGYKQIYVPVENDAGARFDIYNDDTYYYIFTKSGGGLNSTHITDDYSNQDGAVYTGKGMSGTFYITDTSTDTYYHDDAILMFAIPNDDYEDALNEDMALTITASGYQWAPTGEGDNPDQGDITYQSSTVSETFNLSDFLSDTSEWRPSSSSDYPVYDGQDMSANEQFKFMFIDLYAGTLNESAYTPPLEFNGSIQIQYTISDYEGDAVFDAYAYCNQSKRGQGISWTNRLSDTFGNSGWTI
ncbi:MAG: hypothetical protein JW712_06300 [Dehalococcoidales bacterium]|nr:hypothetical protein [Dehalococcoidales bacterium]